VPQFHNESQSEHQMELAHLDRSIQPRVAPSQDAEVQRKRMLIALGILLLALAAVIGKDWDFWFPARGESPEAVELRRSKNVAQESPAAPAAAVHDRRPVKASTPAQATTGAPFTATTERAALPPLQVEVVAGNRHVSVPAKSTAIHVDVGTDGTAAGGSGSAGQAASANDRVQLSPQTTQSVTVTVPPDYPLLARQMKVQGAVSLQALISRDGTIQELQILSGPEILAAAAREAVKQWHFKPYLQNGQPVETQARITVNFTISTN